MRDIHSRYDYEVPGAAAFDYVAGRTEVDAKRVAIMGYSFGGYYSSRIAAFEKRYAACVALSALHWDLAGWQQRIKEKNKSDPKIGGAVELPVPMGGRRRYARGRASRSPGSSRSRTWPRTSPARSWSPTAATTAWCRSRTRQKLYDAVGSTHKTIKIFTAEEGGAEHAHVDNRQVGIDFAADWLMANI